MNVRWIPSTNVQEEGEQDNPKMVQTSCLLAGHNLVSFPCVFRVLAWSLSTPQTKHLLRCACVREYCTRVRTNEYTASSTLAKIRSFARRFRTASKRSLSAWGEWSESCGVTRLSSTAQSRVAPAFTRLRPPWVEVIDWLIDWLKILT